ncbi:MAG: hypothetical protein S4CHLAM20_00290 [Chlamydiia bacterium]|nr:hypothetical protein [Chlamydiia bacterium]
MTSPIETVSFKHNYQYESENTDDNKPASLAFFDEICMDSFSSVFGGRTVHIESLTISEEINLGERIGKAIFLILFAPISIILIICFLIKMAITSSLQEKVKIQRLIGEAQNKIKRVREQFQEAVDKQNFVEAKNIYENNMICLSNQEEIINQMNEIREQVTEELGIQERESFLKKFKEKINNAQETLAFQCQGKDGVEKKLEESRKAADLLIQKVEDAFKNGLKVEELTTDKMDQFQNEVRIMIEDDESLGSGGDSEMAEDVV